MDFLKTWKKIVIKANESGIPLPLVHDPKQKIGSVSLTLVFISSILVVVGIVGKWSKFAGEIDMNNAMEFFYASTALYFGRQWQIKSSTKPEMSVQAAPDSLSLPPSQ